MLHCVVVDACTSSNGGVQPCVTGVQYFSRRGPVGWQVAAMALVICAVSCFLFKGYERLSWPVLGPTNYFLFGTLGFAIGTGPSPDCSRLPCALHSHKHPLDVDLTLCPRGTACAGALCFFLTSLDQLTEVRDQPNFIVDPGTGLLGAVMFFTGGIFFLLSAARWYCNYDGLVVNRFPSTDMLTMSSLGVAPARAAWGGAMLQFLGAAAFLLVECFAQTADESTDQSWGRCAALTVQRPSL